MNVVTYNIQKLKNISPKKEEEKEKKKEKEKEKTNLIYWYN